MSLIRSNIKSGIIWNSVLAGSRIGLQFFGTIILAHILTPDDYGLMGMLAIFVAISETLMDAGMGGALIKKRNASPIDFGTLATYNMIVSISLYVILFFLAPFVADFYQRPILINLLRVYGLVLIIEAIAIVPRVQLMRLFQFKKYAQIGLGANLLSLMAAIIMALLGLGVYSLVGQIILSSIFSSAMMLLAVRYRPSFRFSILSFQSLFGFGVNTTLGNLIKNFAENSFTNIVGKVAPLHITGYYNQGFKLQNIVSSIQAQIIDNALFPILSKEKDGRIIDISIRINYAAAYIVVYVYALLILNAHLIVKIMLGEQWLGMIPYLKLLLVGGIFQSFTAFNRNIFKTLAETFSIVLGEFISLSSLIILFVSMKLGVVAILYTFIAYAIFRWQVSVLLLSKKKYVTYKYYMKHIFISITPTMITFIILTVVHFCNNLMIESIISSLVLTMSIVISGILTQNREYLEMSSLLQSVLKKLKTEKK